MADLERKKEYRATVFRADYFVIRGLGRFLEISLRKYARPGMLVVDIGCGEQPLRTVVEGCGARYIGIDISQNSGRSVHFLSSLAGLGLADECIHLVLVTEVLEHVADAWSAFREIARVLRPGGYVILTSPFMYPLHEEPRDYERHTGQGLGILSEGAGLDVICSDRSGNELEVIATVWDNLWRRIDRDDLPFKAVRLAMRGLVNAPVAVISRLFGRLLPGKSYLSNLLVLQKKGNADR